MMRTTAVTASALILLGCAVGPRSTYVGAPTKIVEVEGEAFKVSWITIDPAAQRYSTQTYDVAVFRLVGTFERQREWKEKQFQAASQVAQGLCGADKKPVAYSRQSFPDDSGQYVDFECK